MVNDSKHNLETILHLPLVNFTFHLNFEKKINFSEWVLLNQAVEEELGVGLGGLRTLTQDKSNLVYRELEMEHKPGFLFMSTKDENSLNVHKRTFKEEKRRFSLVTLALKTFNDNIENWREAHQGI